MSDSSSSSTATASTKPKAKKSSAATPTLAFSPSQTRRAADLLKMAADPTRIQIIRMLADGEKHVGAICAEMNISQAAVSHHLALQRHSGIIECQRRGKNNFYALSAKGRILATAVYRVMAEDMKS